MPPLIYVVWTALLVLVGLFGEVVVRWPDNFFADDSYFYFQVAARAAHGLGSSFNSLMPTNGYHPLWFLVCTAVLWLVPDHDAAVHVIGAVICLLNLLALASITRMLRRAGTTLPYVAWLVYVPFCFTTQLGTEGALSGAAIALLLLLAYRFIQRPTAAAAAGLSLTAGLAVLSRLDNVFVVAALTLGLAVEARREGQREAMRLLLLASPVALVLWGFYLYTNQHSFGTWQPISGLLKAHSPGDHRLGSNLPHSARAALVAIAVCLPLLGRFRRDVFFRVVEVPLAGGVLVHALYITFVLSSETRWSWYYTTWMLLASIVLARVASGLLGWGLRKWARASRLATVAEKLLFCATCVMLLYIWNARSLHEFGHDDPRTRDPGFQAQVVQGAGLHRLLAFDKPGRIAYYSTAEIIPLDGLMGTLRFQHQLAGEGVAAFDRQERIDGFIGPPQPLDDEGKAGYCDQVFLSSVQFHCVAAGQHAWTTDRVQVFARLTQTPAGWIDLPAQQLVFNYPGFVAVWRLAP